MLHVATAQGGPTHPACERAGLPASLPALSPFKQRPVCLQELWALLSSANQQASGIPEKILNEELEKQRLRHEAQQALQVDLSCSQGAWCLLVLAECFKRLHQEAYSCIPQNISVLGATRRVCTCVTVFVSESRHLQFAPPISEPAPLGMRCIAQPSAPPDPALNRACWLPWLKAFGNAG